jgi:hypothetical protein
LVYSFGVGNDHTFEDQMDNLGCRIHAYDPTLSETQQPKISDNFYFHPVGLSKNAFTSDNG